MAHLELWALKLICALIIFVVIVVCTALPIALSKWFYERGETGLMALRVARCFGGGAFLGAFLLHVLPEVDHLIGHALEDKDIDYPVAQIIVGGGFFFIMIMEKVVHACTSSHQHSKPAESMEMSPTKKGYDNEAGPEGAYRRYSDPSDRERTKSITAGELQECVKEKHSDGKPLEYEYAGHHAQSHAHSHAIPGGAGGTLIKSILLLFALSLDCVMEGMALGLQASETGAWNMLIAILSHEFIIGFTLGLQLIKDNPKPRVFCLALFYGITCPIGIAIGIVIVEVSETQGDFDLISGIFQGITGGVFIYVTFFEILADEISSDIPSQCIVSILLGFILLALLSLIPHDHDHTDGHADHGHDHDHEHEHPDVTTALPATLQPVAESLMVLLGGNQN